ncbi:MAG: N-acetyltransferase [Alphaproteobacteria bacterium]
MDEIIDIRESGPHDLASIEALYPDAFPDEDLLPLVKELLQDPSVALSLVGMKGSSLVAHVVLTPCGIAGADAKVALLGPLAVASAFQRQGIGSAMIRSGLQRLEDSGVVQAYVLGDPDYYGRLGFSSETQVAPPYPLPTEWRGAWQSISLGRAEPPRQGHLAPPEVWLRPALWLP